MPAKFYHVTGRRLYPMRSIKSFLSRRVRVTPLTPAERYWVGKRVEVLGWGDEGLTFTGTVWCLGYRKGTLEVITDSGKLVNVLEIECAKIRRYPWSANASNG